MPLAIPANQWSLSGEGPIAILGVEADSLVVERSGVERRLSLIGGETSNCDGLRLEFCPIGRHEEYQLLLQPPLFHQPDLVDETQSILDAGVNYQWEHRGLIEQTLSTLAIYVPEVLAQFRVGMQVAALKPEGSGATRNTSYSRLPGAFTFSNNGNPLTLAEDFIHEFHHNRLFAIEERSPFFDNASVDALSDARYYSPWRRDPRPLHGIWHASYVFTPVVRYWLRLYQAGDEPQHHLEYAADRLVRLPAMLRIAACELERYARWTDFGKSLFDEVRSEHRRLEQQIAAAGVPVDVAAWETDDAGGYDRQTGADGHPLSALDAVRQHARMFDRNGFATDLVPKSFRAA